MAKLTAVYVRLRCAVCKEIIICVEWGEPTEGEPYMGMPVFGSTDKAKAEGWRPCCCVEELDVLRYGWLCPEHREATSVPLEGLWPTRAPLDRIPAYAQRVTTDPVPGEPRDARQRRVYEWVGRTFGAANGEPYERARRFFEEAVELCQSEGVTRADLEKILAHVYGKAPGAPEQEAGGVGTTLLAYCESKGFSADQAEARELSRVLGIPADHFRQRHNDKALAGIAEPAPKE
jgi:hypothetical protein